MKRSVRIRVFFSVGVALFLIVLLVYMRENAREKLTYIERFAIAESELVWNGELSENNISIEMDVPCEVFKGVQLVIKGKFKEAELEIELCERNEEGKSYPLIIKSVDDGVKTTLEYNLSGGKNIEVKDAYIWIAMKGISKNDDIILENMDLRDLGIFEIEILGGQKDSWWQKLYSFMIFAIISYILLLFIAVKGNNESVIQSIIYSAGLIVGVFLLLFIYHSGNFSTFTDENDNIRGGLVIANGGVLYRDYYTQHTPLVYYFCSILAIFGAKSVEQFRILYYIFLALVWGGLYFRHQKFFGKKLMLILPFMETIIVTAMFTQGAMILADNIQGICIVMLLLEYIRYRRTAQFDFLSSLIISLAMWCSIGAAFISIYSLFIIVVGVIISEIAYWVKKKNISFKLCCKRYWKLLLSGVLPGFFLFCYWGSQRIINNVYLQAFKFNTDVYPNYYLEGFGKNKIEPFILSIRNFCALILKNIVRLIGGDITSDNVVRFILCLLFIVLIIGLSIKRKMYYESCIIFLIVCCNASRGTHDFHSLPFWYGLVAVIAILIFWNLGRSFSAKPLFFFAFLILLCSYPYISDFNKLLFIQSQPVSRTERDIVRLTENDEQIFLDAYICDSIYVLYKNRFPVNRVSYILPWYMDWYEEDTLEDISSAKPEVVVWSTERMAWGIREYGERIEEYIKRN